MITQEQFEEFLALEHEIPGVEFKGAGSRRDNPLFGKVVRAAIGMANRRDGGFVIIGVSDQSGVLSSVGLSDEQLVTWRHDDISDGFTAHADPPISFDSAVFEANGKKFVVLQIHEYPDVPIVCKQENKDNSNPKIPVAKRTVVLRKGACYIRRRHKAETVEISSAEDMRELLDLATEKGVKKFITQAQKAGMSLSGSSQPEDMELFNKQLSDLKASLLKKILSRGYWRVIIRPESFSQDKIEYDALYPIMQNTTVSIYDAGFPNVDQRYPLLRGADYIGQEIEAGHILEVWCLYQSGQFIQYSGILEDWTDQLGLFSTPPDWLQANKLAIEEVVRQFTCVFELASRLALTDIYGEDTHLYVDILIKGIQGRRLYISTPGKVPFRSKYTAQIPEYSYAKKFLKEELIASSKELALRASREMFLRFGWDAAQASLEDMQSKFIGS